MVSTARVNTAKASSVEKVYNKKDREEKERITKPLYENMYFHTIMNYVE